MISPKGTYLIEPCKKGRFYIIELPRAKRGDGSGIDTSDNYPGATKRRVDGSFESDEDARKAYRQLIDSDLQRANECAVWYSGDLGE
jgi:hypothetical protein